MVFAIDPGFGYTKAIYGGRRVIFPSALAPAPESDISGYGAIGHTITVRRPNELERRTFAVGERALKEGRATQYSLDNRKFTSENSIICFLTAAYLAGCEGQIDVSIGLPISLFKDKNYQQEVIDALGRIAYYVSAGNDIEKFISVSQVKCLPQGIGAVYNLNPLTDLGLVGLLDIGFYTTDVVLFEVTDKGIIPLNNYFSSINLGVAKAVRLFANKLSNVTSQSWSLPEALDIWNRRKFTYRGKSIDVEPMITEAIKNVGRAIYESVAELWVDKINRLDRLILSGGGALEFGPIIKEVLAQAEIQNDPQFANVLGFWGMSQINKNLRAVK